MINPVEDRTLSANSVRCDPTSGQIAEGPRMGPNTVGDGFCVAGEIVQFDREARRCPNPNAR
jgi:hypothetical protein